jgi:hypothetical protein
MENYKIEIFPTAQQDMEEVIEYLNILSSEAALKYYTFWDFWGDALKNTKIQSQSKN